VPAANIMQLSCALWQVPEWQQAGALGTRTGRFWTIKNNMIRYANGVGVDFGSEGDSSQDLEVGNNGLATGAYGNVFENNVVTDNGAVGAMAYWSSFLDIRNNTFERNGNLHFHGLKRWEGAAIKLHNPSNSVIERNLIRDNDAIGIWIDSGGGMNTTIRNNVVLSNSGVGMMFDSGGNQKSNVNNNILFDNSYGMSFATSGGIHSVYCLHFLNGR